MNVLELFAGSRSIGRVANKLNHTVFSVDWEQYDNINLVTDIGYLEITDIPFVPDVVWASPDCTTYSIAACSTHRKNGIIPISEYAVKCDEVNKHFLDLIEKWKIINPNLIYFIENPRGMLRKMPFMREYNCYTVWYCRYGDSRAKPTDIWTNSKTWTPKSPCFNGNKNCHHQSAPRGSRTGTQGVKGKYNKSKIPVRLCYEIVKSLNKKIDNTLYMF